MELILASASPRRLELLRQIGLTRFTVCPADVDESVPPGTPPDEMVLTLSHRKAEAVGRAHPQALILAADTVVALDDTVLGKPHTPENARRMLTALSGKTHRVYTGFTLWTRDRAESAVESTLVTFRPLSAAEIDAYVATGEPLDKAGAYGIQNKGALLVQSISGDYGTVVGLPLCRLGAALARFGYPVWDTVEGAAP